MQSAQMRYFEKNKEALNARRRERYYANIEKEKVRAKLYYENNRDEIKEKRKEKYNLKFV